MNRVGSTNKRERMRKIIQILAEDSRLHILDISRQLDIPKSTIFDYLKEIKNKYQFTIVEKRDF